MFQPRRGRRRGPRWISEIPIVRVFGPIDRPHVGVIKMNFEEVEAIRLVDYQGLDQETAASLMGISRKSLWLDLHSARFKLAKALIEGAVIQLEEGNFLIRPGHPTDVKGESRNFEKDEKELDDSQ
jgi:Predicted DNA-binding proteins